MSRAIGGVDLVRTAITTRHSYGTTKGSTPIVYFRMVLIPNVPMALSDVLFDLSRISNPLTTQSTVLQDMRAHFCFYQFSVQLLIHKTLQQRMLFEQRLCNFNVVGHCNV